MIPLAKADLSRGNAPDIVVDGLLGTGFAGELRPDLRAVVEAVNGLADRSFVFALDIPSGLSGVTGRPSPVAVTAKATVTFEAAKTGLAVAEAAPYTGKLLVRGIGIPNAVKAAHPCRAFRLRPEIMEATVAALPGVRFGVHPHNDSGLAVANVLEGVDLGAEQVQGTINGYGERCGNANLCSIIPALELKMGISCLPEGRLASLTALANFVSETVNQAPRSNQPYVGDGAFAHKAGIHGTTSRNETSHGSVRPFATAGRPARGRCRLIGGIQTTIDLGGQPMPVTDAISGAGPARLPCFPYPTGSATSKPKRSNGSPRPSKAGAMRPERRKSVGLGNGCAWCT